VYSKDEFARMKDLSGRGSEAKLVDMIIHLLDALTVVFAHNQVRWS
jgi:hypothetical protein